MARSSPLLRTLLFCFLLIIPEAFAAAKPSRLNPKYKGRVVTLSNPTWGTCLYLNSDGDFEPVYAMPYRYPDTSCFWSLETYNNRTWRLKSFNFGTAMDNMNGNLTDGATLVGRSFAAGTPPSTNQAWSIEVYNTGGPDEHVIIKNGFNLVTVRLAEGNKESSPAVTGNSGNSDPLARWYIHTVPEKYLF